LPDVPNTSALTIVGAILDIEVIAAGREIRELARLRRRYGPGRWRKAKGIAVVELRDGSRLRAEVHWYERHGLGRLELKIKRLLGVKRT
jgi:nucleotidyltransferase/DNA polymerase involved in DNA repair